MFTVRHSQSSVIFFNYVNKCYLFTCIYYTHNSNLVLARQTNQPFYFQKCKKITTIIFTTIILTRERYIKYAKHNIEF